MLRLTILNNISGLKCTHLFDDAEFRAVNPEAFVILDSAQVMLPTGRSDLFIIHRQKIASGGIFTWIGLYRAVPNAAVNRDGDYCGVGVWLLNKSVAGRAVVDVLGEAMEALIQWMQSNGRRARDFSRLKLNDLTRDSDDPDLRDLDVNREIGRETICVDASDERDASTLGIYIDAIQNDPDGRFDRFARIMVSNDAAVLKAVGTGGRVPIRQFSDIARPAPAARTPRGADGRMFLLSAPDPVEPPSGGRRSTAGGASELNRLRNDLNRAEIHIEKLSKSIEDLNARMTERRPAFPWSMLVAAILVCLSLVIVYFWIALVVSPSLESEFADGIQKSEMGLRTQIKKLQSQVAPAKGDTDPGPPSRDATSGADQPVASSGGDANGTGSRPATRKPLVPTISQERFEAALSQGNIVIGGGAPMRVVIVAVDALPDAHLPPGVTACSSTGRFDKTGKPQRCSLDDLRQVWPRDAALIFYGEENGPHSVAADLAVKLAGQANVFWYQGRLDDVR